MFDVKADVMAVLAALGLDAANAPITRDAPAWFHPGRSGTLRLGPKVVLAHFGELHPNALKALDVDGPVAGFEIFLNALPAEKKKAQARPAFAASDLLPVKRDFAFVLESKVAAADVVRAASNADKALIADVLVFDLFEGASLGADKKSLAIEVTLQPKDKTLTDAEIEAVGAKVSPRSSGSPAAKSAAEHGQDLRLLRARAEPGLLGRAAECDQQRGVPDRGDGRR